MRDGAAMATLSSNTQKDPAKHVLAKAEVFTRKVKNLNEISLELQRRHRTAEDTLHRMRGDMDATQRHLTSMQQARNSLQGKIDAQTEEEKTLARALQKKDELLREVQSTLKALQGGRAEESGLLREVRRNSAAQPPPTQETAKEALRKAEFIGRQMNAMDEFTRGLQSRHRITKGNLAKMKSEMDFRQRDLASSTQARDKLQAGIDSKKEEEKKLRVALLRKDEHVASMMKDVQNHVRTLYNGREDPVTGHREGGLKRVTRQLQSQELAAARGYQSGVGSTFSVRNMSASHPALPKGAM